MPEPLIALFPQQVAAIKYAWAKTRIIPLIPEKKLPFMRRWWERSTCDEELVRFLWGVGPYDPSAILRKLNAPIFRSLCGLNKTDSKRAALNDALIKMDDLERFRNPHFNIGIATGIANGITVIDVDSKMSTNGSTGTQNWKTLQERFGPCETGLTAMTPSKGSHIYCAHDPRFKTKANVFPDYPGIDVRNDHGLIVAPQSIVWRRRTNGESRLVPYRWKDGNEIYDLKPFLKPVPKALFQLLKDRKTKTSPSGSKAKVGHPRPGASNIKTIIEIIKKDHPGVPEGGRNDECLKVCRKLAGRFRNLSKEEMLESLKAWNETCDPPLAETDLVRKLDSTIVRRESDEAKGLQWAKPHTGKGVNHRKKKIQVNPTDRPPVRLPSDMSPDPKASFADALEFVTDNVPPTEKFIDMAARYLVHRFVGLTDEERLGVMEEWHSFDEVGEKMKKCFEEALKWISKKERLVRFWMKNESRGAASA